MSFQLFFKGQTESFPVNIEYDDLIDLIKKTFTVKYPVIEYFNFKGEIRVIRNTEELKKAYEEKEPGKPFSLVQGQSVIDQISVQESYISQTDLELGESIIVEDYFVEESKEAQRDAQNQVGGHPSIHQQVEAVVQRADVGIGVENRLDRACSTSEVKLAQQSSQHVQPVQFDQQTGPEKSEQAQNTPASSSQGVMVQPERPLKSNVGSETVQVKLASRSSQIDQENINEIIRRIFQQEMERMGNFKEQTAFDGIQCDLCGKSPIFDIMYRCEERLINMCEDCEEKEENQYDLLKIRVGMEFKKQIKGAKDPENMMQMVNEIKGMGFTDHQKVVFALRQSGYNFTIALEEILQD